MIPRHSRTAPALIVALIAAAAGVTVAIDVISVLAGGRPVIWPQHQIATQLRATHFDDIPILAVAAAIAFVGLLLLLAALTRGKPTLIPLDSDDPQLTAGTTRRSLRNAVTAAAMQVDGIDRAAVTLTRRKAKVKVRTGLRDASGLDQQVTGSVEHRLAGIKPARPLTVTTRVNYQED